MTDSGTMFSTTWLVVPAYNEGAVLGDVITEARATFPQIVVVDDCSSDDTAQIARRAGAKVVRHPINLGQGAALQTGIEYALSQGATAVATFDADGQHRTEDVAAMTERLFEGGYDAVIGSRFLGDSSGVPRGRKLLLHAAIWFTWLTSGVKLTDAHNGLRVFSRGAAARLRITQNRMAHASELVVLFHSLGFKYAEHPVTIRYTEQSLKKGQRWYSSFAILRELFVGAISR